eukprot:Em0003g394a
MGKTLAMILVAIMEVQEEVDLVKLVEVVDLVKLVREVDLVKLVREVDLVKLVREVDLVKLVGEVVGEVDLVKLLYKIDVLTEQDHWYLFRRYSEFYALHAKLLKKYGSYGVAQELLPPKKVSGNLSKQHIDNRRQALERYLQKLIVSDTHVSQCTELLEFLDLPSHDIIKMTNDLSHYFFEHGDQLLDQATPVKLSVNEMYSITRRLKLPRDAQGADVGDVASDPAHLYSFVHQLKRLMVVLPPPLPLSPAPPSTWPPFRSVEHLIVDSVPITQLGGVIMVQQNIRTLCLSNTLRSIQEVLVTPWRRRGWVFPLVPGHQRRVVEAAGHSEAFQHKVEVGWKVMVHPWGSLQSLNLSHNSITYLDESLAPAAIPSRGVVVLCLDHNAIQVMDLKCLCLPSLETISIAHNAVERIVNDCLMLERVKQLDVSYNRLKSLEGMEAFVSVSTLNVSFNLLSLKADISRLAELNDLKSLVLAGNPITTSSSLRIILLGKMMNSRKLAGMPPIALDEQYPTSKEEKKITSLKETYGSDPELWPQMKSFGLPGSDLYPSSPPLPSITPTSSHLDLVWGVCSSNDQGRLIPMAHKINPPPQSTRLTSPHASLSSPSILMLLGDTSCDPSPDPKEPVPDRQLSVAESVDAQRDGEEETYAVGSVHTLKTVHRPAITPANIQSALEALAQIAAGRDAPNCSTPREDSGVGPFCPETIANALNAWIASQGASLGGTPLMSPPPSTPLEGSGGPERMQSGGGGSISASDLMAALMALIQPPEGADDSSGGSSLACSAPHSTPQEGPPLGEWLRLGIHPEEVLQALTALTAQWSGEETGDESGSLAPITEEGCGDGEGTRECPGPADANRDCIGVVITGVGVWLVVEGNTLAVVTGNSYASGAAVIIAAGVITTLICVVGIIAAIGRFRGLLAIFGIVLVVVIMLEVAAAVLGFVFRQQLNAGVQGRINSTIAVYGRTNAAVETDAIDTIQTTFECCGSVSYMDWYNHSSLCYGNINTTLLKSFCSVPDSCRCSNSSASGSCVAVLSTTVCPTCSSAAPPAITSIWKTGCAAALSNSVQVNNIGYIAGGFGVAFGIFEVTAVFVVIGLIVCITKGKNAEVV